MTRFADRDRTAPATAEATAASIPKASRAAPSMIGHTAAEPSPILRAQPARPARFCPVNWGGMASTPADEIDRAQGFRPVGAPVHRRRLSRLETAVIARRNVLKIIPALAYRQPMVSGEMLVRWHMLADPAGLKRVLLDNLANYPKSEIMRRMLRPAIGESLFNADGPAWKWQRQAVTPVFTHRNVVALAPAMTATATRAAARLRDVGGKSEMVREMLTATFDVICDVALSGREHFD